MKQHRITCGEEGSFLVTVRKCTGQYLKYLAETNSFLAGLQRVLIIGALVGLIWELVRFLIRV